MATPEFQPEKSRLKNKLFVWAALGISIAVLGAMLAGWANQTDIFVRSKKALLTFFPEV